MKTCPKCSYTRKLADKDKPDWQCPSCGIAYAKFDDRPATAAAPRAVMAAEGQNAMSGKALFWIGAFLMSAAYVAYDTMVAKPEAVAAKIAAAEESGSGDRLSVKVSAELAQIAPSKVVMFATDWCGYCAAARKIFKEQGVRYTEINVERDAEGAKFQSDRLRASGVPTIVIGDRLIHGFDEGQILAGLKAL
jgi:glutaredoxin